MNNIEVYTEEEIDLLMEQKRDEFLTHLFFVLVKPKLHYTNIIKCIYITENVKVYFPAFTGSLVNGCSPSKVVRLCKLNRYLPLLKSLVTSYR